MSILFLFVLLFKCEWLWGKHFYSMCHAMSPPPFFFAETSTSRLGVRDGQFLQRDNKGYFIKSLADEDAKSQRLQFLSSNELRQVSYSNKVTYS